MPGFPRRLSAILSRFVRLAAQVASLEKSLLIALGLAAFGLYLFASVADEVLGKEAHGFDTMVLLAFRDPNNLADQLGPRWFEEMMRDFTAFGGFGPLTVITLTAVGFLALTGKRHAAAMVMLSVASGILASSLLKWGFARPRPDVVPHAVAVSTLSFPSGHAMLSAVVYLTLGALMARSQSSLRVKAYLLCVAAMFTVLIGISRVYLGVHWPTDVLAGWALGASWALVSWAVMLWLQGKGVVERPAST